LAGEAPAAKLLGEAPKARTQGPAGKKRPEMRDVIKRLPKLRGRGKNFLKSRFEKPLAINLSRVKSYFKTGEEINAKTLLEKGLIKTRSGRLPRVKILNG
jgi:hypothetical protein